MLTQLTTRCEAGLIELRICDMLKRDYPVVCVWQILQSVEVRLP